MYHLATALPQAVIFAVDFRDIFALLVLPEKAVMGGEERVLVEEVDEVDNVKDTFHMIAIIITTNSAIICHHNHRQQCHLDNHYHYQVDFSVREHTERSKAVWSTASFQLKLVRTIFFL